MKANVKERSLYHCSLYIQCAMLRLSFSHLGVPILSLILSLQHYSAYQGHVCKDLLRYALLSPRFIFAFGGVGLFTCITAASGLAGVSWNSRALLGMYSVLLVVMLLAQAVVAAALFSDNSWRKYLPPDETGEVKRVCTLLNFHVCSISLAVGISPSWPVKISWPLALLRDENLGDACMPSPGYSVPLHVLKTSQCPQTAYSC